MTIKETIVNECLNVLHREDVKKELFDFLMQQPDCLPGYWREKADSSNNVNENARIIADYIAGMTDRFAISEHKRLCDLDNGWDGAESVF